MKLITLFSVGFITYTTAIYAVEEYSTNHHKQMTTQNQTTSLTEAGNDIFGTIQ